jgi:Protein of unknown function (DUF1573)
MKKVLFILVSFFAVSLNAQNDIQAGKISFNTLDVNYGVIKRDSDGAREVIVTNKGNFPLIITSCSATCGCTVPNCPQDPIMPGKSEVIKITYNTHNIGEFSKNVTVYSNDQVNSMTIIKVHGEVLE